MQRTFTSSLLLTFVGLLSFSSLAVAQGHDWPAWRGAKGDGVWTETGLVDSFDSDQIRLKWSVAIGPGYSGPTVADGRVYVTDRAEQPEQIERVLCFDWETGNKLWEYAYKCQYRRVGYDAGPRACVVIDDGLAYSLGSMGDLFCLNAETGGVVWSHDMVEEYDAKVPIWGISPSPLVEGDLLITQCGGPDAPGILAFHKKTGEEVWRATEDRISYSTPLIVTRQGNRILIVWSGDNILGMNPNTGEIFWSEEFKPNKMVINVPTPVVEGDYLFVTAFYDGSMMLKLSPSGTSAELLWHREGANERETDALHSMIVTPILRGEQIYGVDSYGELRCLDAATGERIWEDLSAVPTARWSNIHMTPSGEKIWMLNERGELLIGKLSPKGFEEIDRAQLLKPTRKQLGARGGVVWSHPAYAYKHIFARNDEELVCASLAKED